MTVGDRAKQFAPFAALTGLTETLQKKEKIVVPRPDLSEESLAELDRMIQLIKRGDMATAVYFKKGECIKITGMVAKVEHTSRILQIVNTRIKFDDLLKLSFDLSDTD